MASGACAAHHLPATLRPVLSSPARNTLLSKHLPPKLVCVVCCSMSALQLQMYKAFLSSKVARTVQNGGKQTLVLASITALKKLCTRGSQRRQRPAAFARLWLLQAALKWRNPSRRSKHTRCNHPSLLFEGGAPAG